MTCSAFDCRTRTRLFMCGSHYRLLPERLKAKLKATGFDKATRLEAIEWLALHEGKEITASAWLELKAKEDYRC